MRSATKKKPYVIARTQSAGVFAGTLESRIGTEAVLTGARRLWYWTGAETLSELAVHGTRTPDSCRFATPVRVELTQVIEIDTCTPAGQASIEGVKTWRA